MSILEWVKRCHAPVQDEETGKRCWCILPDHHEGDHCPPKEKNT